MKKILICLLLSLVLSNISKEYEQDVMYDGEPIPDDIEKPTGKPDNLLFVEIGIPAGEQETNEKKCPRGYRKQGNRCIRNRRHDDMLPRCRNGINRRNCRPNYENIKCPKGKVRRGRKCVVKGYSEHVYRKPRRNTSSNSIKTLKVNKLFIKEINFNH